MLGVSLHLCPKGEVELKEMVWLRGTVVTVVEKGKELGVKKIVSEAPGWCPEWRAFYTRHGFVYTGGESATEMVPVEMTL